MTATTQDTPDAQHRAERLVDAMVSHDVLTAVAREQRVANRVAFYQVTITNQSGVAVGHFTGTVYRTNKPLVPKDEHD